VKIVFPVRSGRGALLRIMFDDGEPAPAGAEVELVGDKEGFFVARRGESFVTGMKDSNQVRLKWKGASCLFDVKLPPGAADEIARVGPLICQGVKR
jgi:outer membrane usher protein